MRRANKSPSYFTIERIANSSLITPSPKHRHHINTSERRKSFYASPRLFKNTMLPSSQTPDRLHQPEAKENRKLKRGFQDDTKSQSDAQCASVTVAVRIRPFATREADQSAAFKVDSSRNAVIVQDKNNANGSLEFFFDLCFDSNLPQGSQESVYEQVCSPLISKALSGYNVCVFAYGQTGSGKSYTIMGTDRDNGIIPRFAKELFIETKKFNGVCLLEASFYEIYNEKIFDLLVDRESNDKGNTLRVRENPSSGPYIEGLITRSINSIEQLFTLLIKGNKNRATACTLMNDRSSRSHAIFSINVIRQKADNVGEGVTKKQTMQSLLSKINFVDLAGSERASVLGSTGERLKEGNLINKSLLTLGKVITQLADRENGSFIAYRESTLTYLLKECLGGNSSTCMIATISPSAKNLEESMSTLRYASKARKIVNQIKNNVQLVEENENNIERMQRNTEEARILCITIREELHNIRCFLNGSLSPNKNTFTSNLTRMFEDVLKENGTFN